jgi:hypothetical protein
VPLGGPKKPERVDIKCNTSAVVSVRDVNQLGKNVSAVSQTASVAVASKKVV